MHVGFTGVLLGTRLMSTVVLSSPVRDLKAPVGRVQAATTSRAQHQKPALEPTPKPVLRIDRKPTVIKTSATPENDALMQYLLRPISILPCFVSDVQNMTEAPGFGASRLRFIKCPYPLNGSPVDLGDIYMLGTHPSRTVRLLGLVVGTWKPDSGMKCFVTCQ